MGLSSKKTKTTPIVSSWMEPKLTSYSNNVSDFLSKDPSQFVAPASPLQTQAFSGAQALGGWKPYASQAAALASQVAGQPAPSASAMGYSAPSLGAPSFAAAPRLGTAPTFEAAQLGMPAPAEGVGLGPVANAQAHLTDFHSILDDGGIQRYLDPALQNYVDASLASYDADVGRRQAAIQADAAKSHAFGGSRYGVQMGEFGADAARGRAQTEVDLRRAAYEQALSAALAEAGRRSQIDLANNALKTQVSGQNAEAENARGLAQGQLDWNRIAADTETRNRFLQSQAELEQQARAANAGMLGQYGFKQADLDQASGLAKLDADLRWRLGQAGLDADAAQFNAAAHNSAALTNAQLQEQTYLRSLQAAGLLGDLADNYGSGDRADLGLTSDLGGVQRGIESDFLNAYPKQLEIAGNLYGAIPGGAYLGQKSKTSGGLGILEQLASSLQFAPIKLPF